MTRSKLEKTRKNGPPVHRESTLHRQFDYALAPQPVTRTQMSTTDPDELAPAFARLYPGASLTPLKATPFHCELRVTAIDSVSFVCGNWAYGAQANTLAMYGRYALLMVGEGSGQPELSLGNERVSVVHQKSAALIAPERPGNLRIPAGGKGRSITIASSALEAHFITIMGHAPRVPILFETNLDLTVGGGATLNGIVQLLRKEIDCPAPSPLIRPRLCDILLTALVTIPRYAHSDPFGPPPPRIAPGIVRRAEEFMAANSYEPITLADIVAAAGAPARSLHAAFRNARGTTPMGFLKSQRLERARVMLTAALPDTTVASVASVMGFLSAGRFSVEYRKQFGESPSKTLARNQLTRLRRRRLR